MCGGIFGRRIIEEQSQKQKKERDERAARRLKRYKSFSVADKPKKRKRAAETVISRTPVDLSQDALAVRGTDDETMEIATTVKENREAVQRTSERKQEIEAENFDSITVDFLKSLGCKYLCQQIYFLPYTEKSGVLQTPFGNVTMVKIGGSSEKQNLIAKVNNKQWKYKDIFKTIKSSGNICTEIIDVISDYLQSPMQEEPLIKKIDDVKCYESSVVEQIKKTFPNETAREIISSAACMCGIMMVSEPARKGDSGKEQRSIIKVLQKQASAEETASFNSIISEISLISQTGGSQMMRDLMNPYVDPLATPQKVNAKILRRGSMKLSPASPIRSKRPLRAEPKGVPRFTLPPDS